MRIHEIATSPVISGKSEIFLDMDGVLADFRGLCQKELGIAGDPTVHLPPEMFKDIIGTDFFDRIPKFDTADSLIDLVLQYVSHYNICSTPLKGDPVNSEHHKRVWIKRELSPQPKSMVFTRHKGAACAIQTDGTPNILIDDFSKNIHEWKLAGGIAIQYDAGLNPLSVVAAGLKKAYGR